MFGITRVAVFDRFGMTLVSGLFRFGLLEVRFVQVCNYLIRFIQVWDYSSVWFIHVLDYLRIGLYMFGIT